MMRLALREMGQRDASLYDDERFNPALSNLHITDVAEYEARPIKYFVKTHALQDDEHQAVYILRDGRDALVSLAHYTVDIVGTDKTYQEVLRMLITGEYQAPYHTWSDSVKFYLRRANTLVIRYERMVEGLLQQMTRVVLFCDIPIKSPLVVSFDSLHRANPKFYRRGIVGSWRDEMPKDLQGLFWTYHGTAMKAAGYTDA